MKNLFILIKFYVIITLILLITNSCNKNKELPLIEDASNLSKYLGQKVTVKGKISQVQWQHTIKFIETHPFALNFDMNDLQIIIYSKTDIRTEEPIEVTGKVIKVDWKSEKAGNDEFAEYHVIVYSYKVINN